MNLNAIKRLVFDEIFKTEWVRVVIDVNVKGVDLPKHLMARGDAPVMLVFGENMPKPIPDLWVDDEGIVATLSFGGKPYTCKVPWEAVFILHGDEQNAGIVFQTPGPEPKRAEKVLH